MKNTDHQENSHQKDLNELNYTFPWLGWLMNNGKALAAIVVGFVACLILYFQVFGSAKTEDADLKAEKEFLALKKNAFTPEDSKAQEKLLYSINRLLDRHTELQSKYDGPIGQVLINLDNISEADPFINRTLQRTKSNHLSFYADYARTTQLICRKDYPQALVKAKDLKKQMLDDQNFQSHTGALKEFGKVLFEFNLLRIATLEEQVGNQTSELKAWKELSSSMLSFNTQKVSTTQSIMTPFIEGKFTLEDYIRNREERLNSEALRDKKLHQ